MCWPLHARAQHHGGILSALEADVQQTSLAGLDALLKQLHSDALQLQAERPDLRRRVIGIDATEPLKADGTLVRIKAAPKAVKDARMAARKQGRVASSDKDGARPRTGQSLGPQWSSSLRSEESGWARADAVEPLLYEYTVLVGMRRCRCRQPKCEPVTSGPQCACERTYGRGSSRRRRR